MFKNSFQSGLFSILFSIGSKPLQIWDEKVGNSLHPVSQFRKYKLMLK
uniref:CFA20 domain-containing protein n=1 Tax=Oryzias sinensis TaxID=183150 RepID=A0A8C8DJ14_9TELE